MVLKVLVKYSLLCFACLAAYRGLIAAFEPDVKLVLIFLVLVIILVVLFFAFKEMSARVWGHQLPFWKLYGSGILICSLTALLMGILDYTMYQYNWSDFGFEESQGRDGQSVLDFMWGYLRVYFVFGLVLTPLVYLIIARQGKRKKVRQ